MATCLPCGHTVDEKLAPHWSYKDVTFYFCDPECQKTVQAEPERWLKIARSPAKHVEGHHHH